MPPSSRSQQKKRRAQRRRAEQEQAERRAHEQHAEQAAPSAIDAGIYTARAHQLLLENQRRTYDDRLSKAYCEGIRNLTKRIADQATLTRTECFMFASRICCNAFPGTPEGIHEDIYTELVERLQVYFASLGYDACADAFRVDSLTRITLKWHSAVPTATTSLNEDD